jgi:riboflavin kinase/FMN adenylyltransferase
MHIYRDIEELERDCSGPVVTVGTFDGVHLGHRKVISSLKRRALKRDAPTLLLTFDPHPKAVVDGSSEPFVLTTVEEKAELVRAAGVDFMLALRFDRSLAETKPREFIDRFLVKRLKIREMVVGYDHHFGFHRSGDISLLRDEGRRLGFDVKTVQPALLDGLPISSTRIRRMLSEGRMGAASDMLGRHYSLSGEVVEGAKRGARVGYRTANILVSEPRKLLPGDGVYAVKAKIVDKEYDAVMNIGVNPTFGNGGRSLEVHIMDFTTDIYGERITVQFYRRIRNEKKFSDENELASQIEKDIEKSRKMLAKERK